MNAQHTQGRIVVNPIQLDQIIGAARDLLTWIEVEHRPPVRDKIEAGRMVRVRLHALADLHDAVKALEEA